MAEHQPVYEYDVVANGYPTVMNLTAADAKRLYPDAKRRDTPLAADHPDRLTGATSAPSTRARTAPNK